MSDWISVNEKKPIYDESILLYNGEWISLGWINTAHDKFYNVTIHGAEDVTEFITHWMHLPIPPKDTE